MVEYDSIIPPGRTGKVTQEVNLHGIRGSFKKDVVVVSNAANVPSLRLYLKGTIRTIIDISPQYVTLASGSGPRVGATVTLKTEKADLVIFGVLFESSGSSPTEWNTDLPVRIVHSLTRAPEKDTDGQYSYTLTMSVDGAVSEAKRGTFIVETNHKQKPRIEIRGMIQTGQ